jgi:hypothetical protein
MLSKEIKEKIFSFLVNLNYNKNFNLFYYSLTIISIVFVIIVTLKYSYITFDFRLITFIFIIEILFFLLFIFELFVRYLSVGDFSKFYKVYFWDIVSIIGWLPLDYFIIFYHYFSNGFDISYYHSLALLRIIRLIRLLTVFKLFGIIEKEIRFLLRNITTIFLLTLLVIFIGAVLMNIVLKVDLINSIKWAFYVVFTAEIPEGLPEQNQKYLIGLFLIISNGILLAGIIGSISSFIMEKYKYINQFDNIPSSGELVIIINYDKEIITSILREYIKTISYAILESRFVNIKILLITKITNQELNELNDLIYSNIRRDLLQYLIELFFVVDKNVLETNFYRELETYKDRINRIFILPDEREPDEYHQDIKTAFVASNIVRALSSDFSKQKVVAITNTDIVNIDEINVIRQHEIISKIINMKIFLPSASLFISNFFTPVGYKIRELYMGSIALEIDKNNIHNLKELIDYIRNFYDAVVIGYIDKNNVYHTLLNKLYKNETEKYIKELEKIPIANVYSIIYIT